MAKLREEIGILRDYLPAQLSEADIEELVRKIMDQIGALGPRDLGRVMKEVMPQVRGRAEGKMVNEVVCRLLEALQG